MTWPSLHERKQISQPVWWDVTSSTICEIVYVCVCQVGGALLLWPTAPAILPIYLYAVAWVRIGQIQLKFATGYLKVIRCKHWKTTDDAAGSDSRYRCTAKFFPGFKSPSALVPVCARTFVLRIGRKNNFKIVYLKKVYMKKCHK